MHDQDFQAAVLHELASLRQELREVRALLQQQGQTNSASSCLPGHTPESTLPERPSPDPPSYRPSSEPPAAIQNHPQRVNLFQSLPSSLQKRLNPLLQQPPPEDHRERAHWLLEISENVDDFMRYEGDDWGDAASFLQQLQDFQDQCGLQRLVPQEGEPVDNRYHLVLQTLPNPERRDQIARCARPGFIYEGELLRRAEVVVYL